MSLIRQAALILFLAAPVALASLPAAAAPNTGKFKRSVEGAKVDLEACDVYKGLLDLAEKEADKRAGTKAAKKYADEADDWWEAGERHGCSWAQ